jgi:TPR repeat protein
MVRFALALIGLLPLVTLASPSIGEAVALQRAGRLDTALAAFRQVAQAGSVEAQYHLAQSLLNGSLGMVNPAEAEYWYGRVRESGLCPSTIRPPEEATQQR